MIVQTYLSHRFKRLKRAFALTRSLIICSAVIAGFVIQSQVAIAQKVTVEVESFIVVDGEYVPIRDENDFVEGNELIILGETDYIYLTPEGKSIIPAQILKGAWEDFIITSTGETSSYNFLKLDVPDGPGGSFDDFAFDGVQHLGYFNGDQNIFALNVDTGEKVQQGSDAYAVIDITADGRVLYTTTNDQTGFERVMLGTTEIYRYEDGFEGYVVDDSREEQNITMNAAGDVFIILRATDEQNQRFELLFKNGEIIRTGDFERVWPYLQSEYILVKEHGAILLNDTEEIHDGSFSISFMIVTPDGDIYLGGDDGIYFYDAAAGNLSIVLLIDQEDIGLTGFMPIGETSRGDFIFSGVDPDKGAGIYSYGIADSLVKPLLVLGDEVGGRMVNGLWPSHFSTKLASVSLNDDQLIVDGALSHPVFELIGAIFRIDLYPDTGPVYTVSELCPEVPAGFVENQSFEEPGIIYPDPFTSTGPIDLREGPCGGNWHTRVWKDVATNKELDFIPGKDDHVGANVTVENTDLFISDGPIIVRSANLSGSLDITNPLTLSNNSSIENLTINADLETNGAVALTGESWWFDGDINGNGSLSLQAGSSNTLTLSGGTLNLGANLSIGGTLSHKLGTLNTSTSDSTITVKNGGSYDILNGALALTGAGQLINEGTLYSDFTEGNEIVSIEIPINNLGGKLSVEGNLVLKKGLSGSGTEIFSPAVTGRILKIGDENSLAEISSKFSGISSISGITAFEGDGHTVTISPASKLTVSGSTEFRNKKIDIQGELVRGILQNEGDLRFGPSTLSGTLINNGKLSFDDTVTFTENTIIRTTEGHSMFVSGDILSEGTSAKIEILDAQMDLDSGTPHEVFAQYHQTGGSIKGYGLGQIPTKLSLYGGGSFGEEIPKEIEFLWSGTLSLEAGEYQVKNMSFVGGKFSFIINEGASLEADSSKLTLGLGIQDTFASATNEEIAALAEPPEKGFLINGGNLRGNSTIKNNGVLWWGAGSFETSALENEGTFIIAGSTARTIDFDVTGNGAIMVSPDVTLTNGHDIEADIIALGGSLKGTADSILKTNKIASIKNTNAFIDLDTMVGEEIKLIVREGSSLSLNRQTLIGPEGQKHDLINNGQLSDAEIRIRDLATLIVLGGNNLNSLSNSIVEIVGGYFAPLMKRTTPLNIRTSEIDFIDRSDLSYSNLILSDSKIFISKSSLQAENISLESTNNSEDRANLFVDGGSSISLANNLNVSSAILDIIDSEADIEGSINLTGGGSELNSHNSTLTVDGNLDFFIAADFGLRSTAELTASTVSVLNCNLNKAFVTVGQTGMATSMHVRGNLDIGTASRLVLTHGSTLVVDDEFEVSGGLSGASAQISGTANIGDLDVNWGGTLTGNGTINGLVIRNNGLVGPGTSPGILTINGDYIQSETGTLEIEVFGTEVGTEYDQLVVTGTATLGGTLYIAPSINFPPEASFEPLVAANVVGGFDRIIVETESARSTFTATLTETNVQISPTTLSVTTFDQYQDALFSETDAADETIGQPTSDPDGDQFSNLLEYAMDLNPWVTNENPMIVEFESNESEQFSRVKVKFPWAKEMTDVSYVLQVSSDMSVWTDLVSVVQEIIDEGTHDFITVGADIDPPATDRLFVRVLVTQNEL
jgi:hypothetical protein